MSDYQHIPLLMSGGRMDEPTEDSSNSWVRSSRVRFRNGAAEKMGGWKREPFSPAIDGTANAITEFIDSSNYTYRVIGTDKALLVDTGEGFIHDITPLRRVTDLAHDAPIQISETLTRAPAVREATIIPNIPSVIDYGRIVYVPATQTTIARTDIQERDLLIINGNLRITGTEEEYAAGETTPIQIYYRGEGTATIEITDSRGATVSFIMRAGSGLEDPYRIMLPSGDWRGIDTDGTNIYSIYATEREVRQIPLSGGAPTGIFSLPFGAYSGLTVAEGLLYALDDNTNRVLVYDLASTHTASIQTIMLGAGDWRAITNDGTNLYLIDGAANRIREIAISGGSARNLREDLPALNYRGITFNGFDLVIVTDQHQLGIVPLDGAPITSAGSVGTETDTSNRFIGGVGDIAYDQANGRLYALDDTRNYINSGGAFDTSIIGALHPTVPPEPYRLFIVESAATSGGFNRIHLPFDRDFAGLAAINAEITNADEQWCLSIRDASSVVREDDRVFISASGQVTNAGDIPINLDGAYEVVRTRPTDRGTEYEVALPQADAGTDGNQIMSNGAAIDLTIGYPIRIGAVGQVGGGGYGAGGFGGVTDVIDTSLNADATATDATITLQSTTDFPTAGAILVGGSEAEYEYMRYTGKTDTTLTGVVRGIVGTSLSADANEIQRQDALRKAHDGGESVLLVEDFGMAGRESVGYGQGIGAAELQTEGIGNRWQLSRRGDTLIANLESQGIFAWQISQDTNRRAVWLETLKEDPDHFVPLRARHCIATSRGNIIAFGSRTFSDEIERNLNLLISDDAQFQFRILGEDGSETEGDTSAQQLALNRGSEIIAVVETKNELLVFTDTALFQLHFTGTNYAFSLISDNISILNRDSVIAIDDAVYWMGDGKFYIYTGRVRTVTCPIRDFVFDGITESARNLIFAGEVERYNEVLWNIPWSADGSATENTMQVVLNYAEGLFYTHELGRSVWLDSKFDETVLAVGNDNRVYTHEDGFDATDDNGAPMKLGEYAQTAPMKPPPYSRSDTGRPYNAYRTISFIPDIAFVRSETATPSLRFLVSGKDHPGALSNDLNEPDKRDGATIQAMVSASGGDIQSARLGDYGTETRDKEFNLRLTAAALTLWVGDSSLGAHWRLGVQQIMAKAIQINLDRRI